MKIKLIDKETKNELGQINLDILPKQKDFIEFNGKVLVVCSVIHSESIIKIVTRETDSEYNITW
ncbi:hypothetical protein ACFO3O_10955 [Dokdonia ponticola]|uniref:Uncharacterized protein n=1 Tax=Dokdonia ponticola TaxID=2041041 RepID=A0ABV9HY33_9FLAO